ncbi:hypothetical protein SAMN05421824_0127 [Hyunsoonleella jejuensis]|uniref:Uncharacterized protein n=1 Tax=Hyunsoonleella jejuensis TaxID=419940 RepID=A0A1H9A402_9FLAO|nr:hypothetical protein [Hyunsoonleella jejuensis]SEP71355.1 hypothetical protein SAMN05421824_0127 [Hyunsoonleella jejuensis]
MKYVAYVIIILALGLGIFNATKLNFDALFEGESIVSLITIVSALCAIILMLILLTSKRIEEKLKQKK